MTELVFYGKSGCSGNLQQQALLRGLGYRLDVRDLQGESWTAESLHPFLAARTVPEWFNLSAPRVRSGEIDIHALTGQEAMELLLAEPLLICRPLLQYGGLKQAGFAAGPVLDALQVSPGPDNALQSCPVTASGTACGQPG